VSKQRTQKAPEPSASRSPAPIIAAAVVLGVLGLLIYTMLANSPGQQTAAQPVEAIPTIPVVPAVPTTPAEPAQPVAPAEPAAPAANSQTYSALPPMTIDPAKDYTATISMAKGGEIVIKLRPDLAPQTVNSFVFLAREGFYDGLTFHRVEPGFVIQGGDPDGTGTGGPGYNVPDEYTDQVLFDRPGLLAMASTGPGTNSGGSQFFITLGPADWLNNQYTIFGEVLAGQELVDAVQVGDVMQSVMISEG
jgi:peptidylprolyl isomerase